MKEDRPAAQRPTVAAEALARLKVTLEEMDVLRETLNRRVALLERQMRRW